MWKSIFQESDYRLYQRINNPPIPKTEWHPLFILDYIHLRISILSTGYRETCRMNIEGKKKKKIRKTGVSLTGKWNFLIREEDRCVGNNIYSDIEAREIAMNWILHRVMGNGIYNIFEKNRFEIPNWIFGGIMSPLELL